MPYILSAVRTPIGKFLGGLAPLTAPKLGALAAKEAVARSGIGFEAFDEVIIGSVVQAGVGQNPARQAALHAGFPDTINAWTVNKVCGSGLQAVMNAAQSIKAGDASVVLAGGMESMSNAPHLARVRTGIKYGNGELVDALVQDGLWCAFENWPMGNAAEHTAKSFTISRTDQDTFAVESHKRAAAAQAAGWFNKEIVAVEVAAGKATAKIEKDEGIRADSSVEGLAKLKPAFDKAGTVTAGNSSQLSDGAAAVVVAAEGHSKPLASIVSYATSGVTPKDIFIAPVTAIRMALKKADLQAADIDLFEINEAFASQMLACCRGLALPMDRVNVSGGGVALGHPIGASGTRCLVTLLHGLKRSGGKFGCVSLCLGGGNAVAMVVENLSA